MSLINNIIPQQGFEIVRDVIGAVITTELLEQKVKQGFSYPINVYIGRSIPFQSAEKIMINVLLDSGNYSQHGEKSVSSGTNFFIDVYTSSKESDLGDGDYNSTVLKDKFLGMIRYILQDHHYKTLGLPLGLIMGTYVEGFENFESSNNQDAAFIKIARLRFNVRINESQSLWEGVEIDSMFTDVKLDLTDNGYKYVTEIN
jgi:hypothetical protein